MLDDSKEEKRKEKIISKINLFTWLMDQLSKEVVAIYTEGKEEIYHDVIIRMVESLDAAQTTVKKAYYMHLGRDISTN